MLHFDCVVGGADDVVGADEIADLLKWKRGHCSLGRSSCRSNPERKQQIIEDMNKGATVTIQMPFFTSTFVESRHVQNI